MTIEEQQDLFGAPPGGITSVSLVVHLDHELVTASVSLHIHTAMRKHPMQFVCVIGREHDIARVLGLLNPIIMRAHYLQTATIRRSLIQVHDRLGNDGYEVNLFHCGDPRRVKF